MLSRRERLRFAASGSALALGVVLALVAAHSPKDAVASEPPGELMRTGPTTMSARGTLAPALRALAQPYGLRLGSAVNSEALLHDQPYAEVLAREFGTVTAEDAMKWGRRL